MRSCRVSLNRRIHTDAYEHSSGIPQISDPNWLSTQFNPADGELGMQDDYDAGLFDSDDLLARVQADLNAFFWQSHTMTHLSRDNLGKNDCDIEDGGEWCLSCHVMSSHAVGGWWGRVLLCWHSRTDNYLGGWSRCVYVAPNSAVCMYFMYRSME